MAVDAPVLYNDYWVYLRYDIGSTHLNPNDKQIHNAYKIRSRLRAQGYQPGAIAGILGCWQVESGLTPGALDTHLSKLPNSGEHLAELTNSVMLGYCDYANPSARGYGTGLAQWDRGVSSAAPQGNVIASYAIRNNMEWYDGDLQMMRLEAEYQLDLAGTYTFWYHNWGDVTWEDYKGIVDGPGTCALIFNACFERSSGTANPNRKDNAEFWYQYFIDHPIDIKTAMPIIFQQRKKVLKNVYHP